MIDHDSPLVWVVVIVSAAVECAQIVVPKLIVANGKVSMVIVVPEDTVDGHTPLSTTA